MSPYYDTIEDDLRRAREILAKGKMTGEEWVGDARVPLPSGTISGADIYAAYQLLQAFVSEIERLQHAAETFTAQRDAALAQAQESWAGWTQEKAQAVEPRADAARCPLYQPDHNGECVDCDEWADAHTPEALVRGEALAARLAEAHAPLRQEIAALKADAARERAARAVVDAALRQAVEDRDAAREDRDFWDRKAGEEHALVEAVGRTVCELALRQQRRAASGPTGAGALRHDLSQPDDD